MRAFAHRVVLPPVFLGLHVVLLLPLFLAEPCYEQDPAEQPPYKPGEISTDRFQQELWPQYSLPLGIAGVLILYTVRRLAGKIPLPRQRATLAAWIEWAILFFTGVLEEILRWGISRLLVGLEGGKGGLRGTDYMFSTVVASSECVPIWKGVYLMGWAWSFTECTFSWWTIRPVTDLEQLSILPSNLPPRRGSRSNLATRRPLLAKRIRSDHSTVGGSSDDGSERRSLLGRLHKKNELQSSRSREVIIASPTAEVPLQTEASGSGSALATNNTHNHVEGGTEVHHGLKHGSRPQQDSDSSFGDDEGSESGTSVASRDSSFDSPRDESQTPLLSSSAPHESTQEQPIRETQSLLNSASRQFSYSTITDSIPAPSILEADGATSEVVSVHEDDISEESPGPSIIEEAPENEQSSSTVRRSPVPRRQRIYPSFPSYSASYNQSYFPVHTSPSTSARHRRRPRRIYGLPVENLSVKYPILWRLAAALRHISHPLFFAWAPAMVFQHHFQPWCLFVLVFFAVAKGIGTVKWFGGGVARSGVLGSSLLLLSIELLVYFVGLGIWGMLW